MKARNLVIQAEDGADLKRIVDDYNFIGREVDYDQKTLKVTVLALPRSYKKKRDAQAKAEARKSSVEDYDAVI